MKWKETQVDVVFPLPQVCVSFLCLVLSYRRCHATTCNYADYETLDGSDVHKPPLINVEGVNSVCRPPGGSQWPRLPDAVRQHRANTEGGWERRFHSNRSCVLRRSHLYVCTCLSSTVLKLK